MISLQGICYYLILKFKALVKEIIYENANKVIQEVSQMTINHKCGSIGGELVTVQF